MITEDYVSFETAKLLKEKGFQAKCTACYHNDHRFELVSGRINYCNPRFSKYKMIPPYNAPTLQMAMKWLREKHIVIIPEVETFYADGSVSSWEYHIWCDDNYEKEQHGFSSYEGACEAAIKYCLENFI